MVVTMKKKPRKRLVKYREDQKAKKKQLGTGNNYRPDSEGPNVGEAKEIIKEMCIERGFKVKSISFYTKDENFLVTFELNTSETFSCGGEKYHGPYGMKQIRYGWDIPKMLYKGDESE